MLFAYAQKPAEAEHRVGYVPTDLIDHEPLNRTDPFAVRAAHHRSFHSIAWYQRVRLVLGLRSRFCCRHNRLLGLLPNQRPARVPGSKLGTNAGKPTLRHGGHDVFDGSFDDATRRAVTQLSG